MQVPGRPAGSRMYSLQGSSAKHHRSVSKDFAGYIWMIGDGWSAQWRRRAARHAAINGSGRSAVEKRVKGFRPEKFSIFTPHGLLFMIQWSGTMIHGLSYENLSRCLLPLPAIR